MPKLLAERFKEDTIRQFRAAAAIRNEDARELALAGRLAAAVYLWGYVAEMTLKAGFFALDEKFDDEKEITRDHLRKAVNKARSYQIGWQGGYHAIPYWAQLLREHRIAIGKPYPDSRFGVDVEEHSRRIYERWRETMRYKKNRPYPREVRVVSDSVRWLLSNSRRL